MFAKIVERLFVSRPDNKTLFQVACEELMTSMRFLKDTKDSQFVMRRMLLIIASLKDSPDDEYNNIGENGQCLMHDSKLKCLEILKNEFNVN